MVELESGGQSPPVKPVVEPPDLRAEAPGILAWDPIPEAIRSAIEAMLSPSLAPVDCSALRSFGRRAKAAANESWSFQFEKSGMKYWRTSAARAPRHA